MGVLWTADLASVTNLGKAVPPWTAEQEPNYADSSINRVTVVENGALPGTGAAKPSGRGMRVELRPFSSSSPGSMVEDGDVCDTGGYHANRAEVLTRNAIPSSTAPSLWPDPPGSQRWYAWSMLAPSDFTPVADTRWLVFTQWKGQYGLPSGSPPLSMEIKRSNWRLGGKRTNAGLIPSDGTIGAISFGVWTRFVVGMFLSPDDDYGWVELWQDGVKKIPRTSVATMDYVGSSSDPDPMYLKQGIYRDTTWTTTNTLYFGPMTIGTSPQDVGLGTATPNSWLVNLPA